MVCLSVAGAGCEDPQGPARPGDRTVRRTADRVTPAGSEARSGDSWPAAGGSGPLDSQSDDGHADTSALTGRVHCVQPKETLYSIARQYYGDDKHYRKIWVANRNRLKDPDKLPVGMKLIIP